VGIPTSPPVPVDPALPAFLPALPGPVPAALLAAVGVAAWFLLLGLVAVATRAPSPRPGPPTGQLRPESPAVVDLVTGNWRLCEEAAAATLLDLAARRVLSVEEIGPELSLIRLGRGPAPSDLNRYERMVYDHVRVLARDGVVATGALAEGARHLGSWWKGFRKAVIAETRERGLSRLRWRSGHRTLMSVAATVPAALVGFAVLHLPPTDGEESGVGAALGGALVTFVVLTGLMERLNTERGTRAGVAVAGHWLGVREHLARTGRFGEHPAAAVTIWGRPLAYAAALGLAPRAVASLPVASPADDRRAWSDYGGMWHVVDVRYRGRGPIGYLFWGRTAGRGILAALVVGFAVFTISFILLIVGAALLDWALDDPFSPATTLAVLAAAVPVAFALVDLTSRPTVEGQVVRRRRYRVGDNDSSRYNHWVAIDEGTHRTLHAFGLTAEHWHRVQEGDLVRARVGRRFGWIYGIDVVARGRYGGRPSDGDHASRGGTPRESG
jgi:hypothetical protein